MKLSIQEVEHVARLARLALTEEEKELFSRQLSDILTYIQKLKELNTDGVPPTSHVLPLKNVFREDRVRPSLLRERSLSNAPEQEGGFFRVPKIIE